MFCIFFQYEFFYTFSEELRFIAYIENEIAVIPQTVIFSNDYIISTSSINIALQCALSDRARRQACIFGQLPRSNHPEASSELYHQQRADTINAEYNAHTPEKAIVFVSDGDKGEAIVGQRVHLPHKLGVIHLFDNSVLYVSPSKVSFLKRIRGVLTTISVAAIERMIEREEFYGPGTNSQKLKKLFPFKVTTTSNATYGKFLQISQPLLDDIIHMLTIDPIPPPAAPLPDRREELLHYVLVLSQFKKLADVLHLRMTPQSRAVIEDTILLLNDLRFSIVGGENVRGNLIQTLEFILAIHDEGVDLPPSFVSIDTTYIMKEYVEPNGERVTAQEFVDKIEGLADHLLPPLSAPLGGESMRWFTTLRPPSNIVLQPIPTPTPQDIIAARADPLQTLFTTRELSRGLAITRVVDSHEARNGCGFRGLTDRLRLVLRAIFARRM